MSTRSKSTIIASLQRLMIWVLVLATWEAAYRFIGWKSYVFPAPSHVVDATLSMLNLHTEFGEPVKPGWPMGEATEDGGIDFSGLRESNRSVYDSPLIVANVVSILRLVSGFVISVTLGAVLGLLMWRWKFLDDLLGPLFLGMQTLPSVCWVPLAILCLGFDERAVHFVLVMGSFFAIAISLRDGLRTIPPLYHRAGLMLGADSWRLYRYVLLPASLPALSSSLRSGFSFAWRSLMGAELILASQRHGLGFLLSQGRDTNDSGQVVAVMIMMVALGILADRLVFAMIEQRIYSRFGLSVSR